MATPAGPSSSALKALQLLRSQIFQTSYNPTSIRTGAKYLRRALRGPSMVAYHYPTFSLPNLLRNPRYAFDPPRPVRPPKDARYQVWAKYEDELRRCRADGNVESGFVEVERDERAGWLRDQKEWDRMQKVAKKRILGQGPPKKGEGRRSQVGKKR